MNLDNKQKYLYKISQAVEKHPSAALLHFIIAAYHEVSLIPRDFARLASECF